ncbi:MAG TPA: hypothetical protein VFK24_10850 [Gammaproteobacteria bacterium]|nr:hypothetical protein [Gammaproteobacteria bacterium]
MKIFFAFIAVVFLTMPAVMAAQPVAASGQMAKLNFLVGTWQGHGWIMTGPGRRHTFTETETVTSKLGGDALLIDGLGKSTDTGDAGKIIHRALAMASYDAHAKTFRWYALQAGGSPVDTQAKVSNDTLVWHMTVPNGKLRFTIKLNDKKQWHEVGQFSRDGKTWYPFFEMTLSRLIRAGTE